MVLGVTLVACTLALTEASQNGWSITEEPDDCSKPALQSMMCLHLGISDTHHLNSSLNASRYFFKQLLLAANLDGHHMQVPVQVVQHEAFAKAPHA